MTTALATAAFGAALYAGEVALPARLRGHDEALPAVATRCPSCHEGPSAIGPPLSAATLAAVLPRRGGPPSRYDGPALCRLLRDGTDPAHVLVRSAMPVYTIDDAGCKALWIFLSTR